MAAQESESPRIRVAGALVLDGGVLLVRHQKDGESYHLLPGGGVAYGETLGEALEREFLEETGIVCEIGRPLLLNDSIAPDGSRHVVQVTFAVERRSGALVESSSDPRVAGFDTVRLGDLSGLDLRPPMASELKNALEDPATETRYLGALWSGP